MVWVLAGQRPFKEEMLAKDDLVAYLQGLDVSSITEDGVLDSHRNSLKDSGWENLRMEVYDRDLMFQDWEDLKIHCYPHPKFPDDPLKFDPMSYSERHYGLQPNACFVGPVLMEKFKHLRFRVIVFFLQIYDLGQGGEYPVPDNIFLHIMDAREGQVKYSVTIGGVFVETMDDGRTLFMFVDTEHVNAMYRKTPKWHLAEQVAEQKASLKKAGKKKKRAARPA
jgi:hypothetical protein